MAIADQLNKLATARKNIISAIVAKGVSCANTVKLSELPSYIAKITSSIGVTVLGHKSVYGTVNVVGTSTSSPYTIANSGTLIVGGGFDGGGYANYESEHWVKVYINGSLKYTFTGTASVKSFSKTLSVTKGQKLYIQAHSRTNDDPYWKCFGGVSAQLVYLK